MGVRIKPKKSVHATGYLKAVSQKFYALVGFSAILTAIRPSRRRARARTWSGRDDEFTAPGGTSSVALPFWGVLPR